MTQNFESLQKIYRSLVLNMHNQLAYENSGMGSYPTSQFPTNTNFAMGAKSKLQPKNLLQTDFWAKGKGYGTGNMDEHWSLTAHVEKQKQIEEMISCLLKVIFCIIFILYYIIGFESVYQTRFKTNFFKTWINVKLIIKKQFE